MYAGDVSFDDIREKTGLSKYEIERLVKRCVTFDGAGHIYGFRALIPNLRIKVYSRKANIQGVTYDDRGGSAGALAMLHDRFSDVAEKIEELLLKKPLTKGKWKGRVHEARIPYKELHNDWLSLLREKGLKDNDWPFNRQYRGYRSFVTYCHAIGTQHLARFITARSGIEAGRKDGLGQGNKTLLPLLRPYTYAQLDFHKEDAASIIVIRNEFDVEFDIPVARWHIGLLAEEKSRAILGVYISLEANPSGDCVLETVLRGLRPESKDDTSIDGVHAAEGKIVINQILPEFAYQGFAALKIDNAWCNAATEVYNNIITTVGCAVNFGPVRMWWRRPLIESIFRELTSHGLQRMPSTYGTGPNDSRRTDPISKAIQFRILLSTLIDVVHKEVRRYNEHGNEGLQFAAPVKVLSAALSHHKSGFFLQPLPKSSQGDMRLMMHIEERTVRGNIKKNVRPFVKFDRCVHTNYILASRYDLVGKKLVVYINRRKCREVHATVLETAEYLGQLKPGGIWANSECSWRVRKIINASGLAEAYHDESISVVTQWSKDVAQALTGRRGKDIRKQSKTALKLAKVLQDSNIATDLQLPGTTTNTAESLTADVTPSARSANIFGIDAPDIPLQDKKNHE